MHTIKSLNIFSVYLYNSIYTLLINSRGIDLKISILHVFLYIYNILDIKKRKIIDQLCYILVYKYIYLDIHNMYIISKNNIYNLDIY